MQKFSICYTLDAWHNVGCTGMAYAMRSGWSGVVVIRDPRFSGRRERSACMHGNLYRGLASIDVTQPGEKWTKNRDS